MNYRHQDCDVCDVIKGVLERLKRIETAAHQEMSDPLSEAQNAIASMQLEAILASAELLPLVMDMKPERAPADRPIGAAARREDGRD